MGLQDKKIINYANGVSALPDRPSDNGITAEQLKAIFDSRTDNEVRNAINEIIDELTANTGAEQIGTADGKSVEEKLHEKVSSVNGKSGEVVLVRSDVGLGNVDNTSDINKPISEATQSALNSKADATSPTIMKKIVLVGGSKGEQGEWLWGELFAEGKVKFTDDMGGATQSLIFDLNNSKLKFSVNDEVGEVYTSKTHPKLDLRYAALSVAEQSAVRDNIGVTALVGDIESALDGIIALQNSYTGGVNA